MNRLYNTVVPSRDAIYNPQGCSELIHFLNISLKIHFQTVIHLQSPRVQRANTFFKYIIKNTFSNCHQTLKQIATGSPLDAANYNPLL